MTFHLGPASRMATDLAPQVGAERLFSKLDEMLDPDELGLFWVGLSGGTPTDQTLGDFSWEETRL